MDNESRRLLDDLEPREFIRVVSRDANKRYRTTFGYYDGIRRKKGRWWYVRVMSIDQSRGEDILTHQIQRIMSVNEAAATPGEFCE